MDSIIDGLLSYEIGRAFRETVTNVGFQKILEVETVNWDVRFIERNFKSTLLAGNALLVGYDIDFEFDIDEWIQCYQEKEANDIVVIYTMPITEILKQMKCPTREIKTSKGKVNVPCKDKNTDFIVLPFEREWGKDILSAPDRDLVIPTELMTQQYNPPQEQLTLPGVDDYGSLSIPGLDFLSSLGERNPELRTMPIVMYVGPGKRGYDYILESKELEIAFKAQQDFIDENQNDLSLQDRINHALEFLKKYSPFIKP